MIIISRLDSNGGFYTKIGMQRLDERRIYYEYKKKKKLTGKTKVLNDVPISELDLQMIVDGNQEKFDDSYIPGAY